MRTDILGIYQIYPTTDLYLSRPKTRRKLVKGAMLLELSNIWNNISEARITHIIHPTWENILLPRIMASKYVLTVFQNLAVGRGPLRAVVFRDCGIASKLMCRHGCNVAEDLEHIIFQCGYVNYQRAAIQRASAMLGLTYDLRNLFTVVDLQRSVEHLIIKFFKIKRR